MSNIYTRKLSFRNKKYHQKKIHKNIPPYVIKLLLDTSHMPLRINIYKITHKSKINMKFLNLIASNMCKHTYPTHTEHELRDPIFYF